MSAILTAALVLAALPALAQAAGRWTPGRRLAATRPRGGFVRRQAAITEIGAATRDHPASPPSAARRSTRRRRGHARHRGGCANADARVGAVRHAAVQRAVVCLLNRQRRRHGLPALRANRRLDASAQSWTNAMVRQRAFSHGTDFTARITATGFNWSRLGENIATGFRTPQSVVRAWMASTGHCQNILSPDFREVGTGVDAGSAMGANARGTWTQDFGLRMGQRGAGSWAPAEGCPY